jgi:hypothetical protein
MTSKVGFSYPLEIVDGGLKLATGIKLTEQAVLSVLETRPGERVMRGDYGLPNLIFSQLNPSYIDTKIELALKQSQVDASVIGDNSEAEDGRYRLRIDINSKSYTLTLEE